MAGCKQTLHRNMIQMKAVGVVIVHLHSIEFSIGCSQGGLYSIGCSMFVDHPYSKRLNFQLNVCLGKQVVAEDMSTWRQIRNLRVTQKLQMCQNCASVQVV